MAALFVLNSPMIVIANGYHNISTLPYRPRSPFSSFSPSCVFLGGWQRTNGCITAINWMECGSADVFSFTFRIRFGALAPSSVRLYECSLKCDGEDLPVHLPVLSLTLGSSSAALFSTPHARLSIMHGWTVCFRPLHCALSLETLPRTPGI